MGVGASSDTSCTTELFPRHDRNRLIGVIYLYDSYQIDTILTRIASEYSAKGYQVGGVLQSESAAVENHTGDMVLRSIGTDRTIKISQNLGNSSKACRVDFAALLSANSLIEATMSEGNLDLLILNRFGRAEAEGGGMRSVIEKAFARGIPTLIPVRPIYISDWNEFVADLSEPLNPDFDSIADWCDSVLMSRETKTQTI